LKPAPTPMPRAACLSGRCLSQIEPSRLAMVLHVPGLPGVANMGGASHATGKIGPTRAYRKRSPQACALRQVSQLRIHTGCSSRPGLCGSAAGLREPLDPCRAGSPLRASSLCEKRAGSLKLCGLIRQTDERAADARSTNGVESAPGGGLFRRYHHALDIRAPSCNRRCACEGARERVLTLRVAAKQ
jgi:hypothetical protein